MDLPEMHLAGKLNGTHMCEPHLDYVEDHRGRLIAATCFEQAMQSDGETPIDGLVYPVGRWVEMDHDDPDFGCDVCKPGMSHGELVGFLLTTATN